MVRTAIKSAPKEQTKQQNRTPTELQRHTAAGGPGEDHIGCILHIDGSDADGVRMFQESLPLSLVRALLDPNVADFFIPITGSARLKPPSAKSHWLHTGYIREIVLLDKLPREEVDTCPPHRS